MKARGRTNCLRLLSPVCSLKWARKMKKLFKSFKSLKWTLAHSWRLLLNTKTVPRLVVVSSWLKLSLTTTMVLKTVFKTVEVACPWELLLMSSLNRKILTLWESRHLPELETSLRWWTLKTLEPQPKIVILNPSLSPFLREWTNREDKPSPLLLLAEVLTAAAW